MAVIKGDTDLVQGQKLARPAEVFQGVSNQWRDGFALHGQLANPPRCDVDYEAAQSAQSTKDFIDFILAGLGRIVAGDAGSVEGLRGFIGTTDETNGELAGQIKPLGDVHS